MTERDYGAELDALGGPEANYQSQPQPQQDAAAEDFQQSPLFHDLAAWQAGIRREAFVNAVQASVKNAQDTAGVSMELPKAEQPGQFAGGLASEPAPWEGFQPESQEQAPAASRSLRDISPMQQWEKYPQSKQSPVSEAFQQGLYDKIRGGYQTIQALQGETPSKFEQNPNAAPYEWSDLGNPGSAGLPKTAYRLGASVPAAAAGIAGGLAGGALAGPPGALGLGAVSAGAAEAATEFGPYFGKRLAETPYDPDEAFQKAFEDASISGLFTSAGWAVLPLKFFTGPVKNVVFQAFGIQPLLGAEHQAVTNYREGEPLLKDVGQAYTEGAVSGAAFMGAHGLLSTVKAAASSATKRAEVGWVSSVPEPDSPAAPQRLALPAPEGAVSQGSPPKPAGAGGMQVLGEGEATLEERGLSTPAPQGETIARTANAEQFRAALEDAIRRSASDRSNPYPIAPDQIAPASEYELMGWLNRDIDHAGSAAVEAARTLGIDPTVEGIKAFLRGEGKTGTPATPEDSSQPASPAPSTAPAGGGAGASPRKSPEATVASPETAAPEKPAAPQVETQPERAAGTEAATVQPPSFEELHRILPEDADGYADVAALNKRIAAEFGKPSWAVLTDDERRKLYEEYLNHHRAAAPQAPSREEASKPSEEPQEASSGPALQPEGEVVSQAEPPALSSEEAKKPHTVVTPDGSMRVEVTPEIVELSSLRHAEGEFQPRDRSRTESAAGIRERAANLDPVRLQAAPVSDSGAPIADASGTILSGNGRTASIREAYQAPALKARADAYRASLGEKAKGMKEPVLIMRLPKDMSEEDKKRFADLSNRSAIAAMPVTDRAIRDARQLGLGAFASYQGGDLSSSANRPFLRHFLAAPERGGAAVPNELGAMSKDGALTKEGQDRIHAAILAAAYKDPAALQLMLESTDDNIRAITQGLRDAAGKFADLRAGIEAGLIMPGMDGTPSLMEAVKLISYLRSKGVKPADYFAQADMFGSRDPLVQAWVRAFYNEEFTRALSQAKITEVLNAYAEEAIKHQTGGFIEDPTQAGEVLAAALRHRQPDLFASSDGSPATGQGELLPGSQGGSNEGASGRGTEIQRPGLAAGSRNVEADDAQYARVRDFIFGAAKLRDLGGIIGIPERELTPLLERAKDDGLLRKTRHGYNRTPAARLKVEEGAAPPAAGNEIVPLAPSLIAEIPVAGDIAPGTADTIIEAPIPDVVDAPQEENGEDNAGTAVHWEGPGPLEEVAPEDVQGDAKGRDAEPGSAEREQGSGAAGGGTGEGRGSKTRGRGNSSAGAHSSAAGKGKVKKGKAQKVKERARDEPALFEQSPELEIQDAAPVNVPALDFVIDDTLGLGKGNETQKYEDNLAAIRVLKELEAQNRRASPEEQRILARYVGWGGLKNAFRVGGAAEGEGIAKGWEARAAGLEALLTPAELKAARNSTTAAHYTSQAVVQAMWSAAARLGFDGGAVLEPSVGTGNFIGLMPEELRGKSSLFAVEYDSLTARIARALYPNAAILHSGFENVPLPSNQFALAIGNPPFGREALNFRYNASVNGKSIHNQFFLASMDGLATGGLLAMVVSHNLMDALDPSARLDMAERAEFIGAVRLPDTAFKENARTEVVTDIMFFRKRSPEDRERAAKVAAQLRGGKVGKIEEPAEKARHQEIHGNIESWVKSSKIADPAGSGEEINANAYFLRNPGMVVGKIDATGTMNRRAELNVRLADPARFAPLLHEAIGRLPQTAPQPGLAQSSVRHFARMVTAMRLAADRAEPGQVKVDKDGKLRIIADIDAGEQGKSVLTEIELTKDTPFNPEYSLNLDGKWQRTTDKLDEAGKKIKVKKDGKETNRNEKQTAIFANEKNIPEKDRWGAARIELLRDLLPVRDLMKQQFMLEAGDAPARQIAANREKLNKAYDAFTAKHGKMHGQKAFKIAGLMPDGALALAAEAPVKGKKNESPVYAKSAIMSRRVTIPPKVIEQTADVSDAIAISLSESGRIDTGRVASLLGVDEAGAGLALSKGENPPAFFDPEENRWEPADLYLSGMVRRKLNAARAAGLEKNIAALQAVLPPAWNASQIMPNIGSAWIPAPVYAGFIRHLGYSNARVTYSALTNSFSVWYEGRPTPQWATSNRAHDPAEIVSRLLNSQSMKVEHTDRDGKRHVDEEATAESQQKAAEIFNEFQEWAYADQARREKLVETFNDRYNTRVIRQRDGSHLKLPGKVPDTQIKMRRHQMNAIWRGITDPAVLYDHVVGAGKTFTAIARAMERRRMGLSRKPMIAVPNHLVEQWAEDARLLYPAANILAAGKADFERSNRRRLFARIAAGDYDMVIVGHSSFAFIDLDQATEERYLKEELEAAYKAVKEAEAEAISSGQDSGWRKPFGVKEAERLVKKLEDRLGKLRDVNRDRLLTWEEMGVDDLTVDEAHEFKNLAYSSRLTGVAGMGNKAGSQKAMDLHLKIRSLRERAGTSVCFMTGTPISNSAAEMYLVLRNLAPKELAEMGIDNFDAWRSMYVSYASAYEPTEAGSLKEVTRLGRQWMNMRSLMDLYYSVADAVTIEDIKRAFEEDNPGEKFPVPDVRSAREGKGDREGVNVQPTKEQRDILSGIFREFNELPGIKDPKERNKQRLRLMDRARKVSLDPRAAFPGMTVTAPSTKIQAVVDRAFRTWEKWESDKGTQIIFLDRSVPAAKGDDKVVEAYDAIQARLARAEAAQDEREQQAAIDALEKYNPGEIESLREAVKGGWNAYDEIKRLLIAKGVPPEEIRFVQEADTDKKKMALFQQVRDGEVRIVIGSTPRMGAGTNVQDRLVALHHVDVTWKPSDIEQREGRIVRQGNKLLEKYGDDFVVDVIAYATEMTIDAKMWHLNSEKLRSINGIRKYDGAFEMEFEDQESASMAEMAALATGNPLMVERVVLTQEIQKLELQERAFKRRQAGLREQYEHDVRRIEKAPEDIERLERFADTVESAQKGVRERARARSITVDGKTYGTQFSAETAAEKAIFAIKGDDAKARFSLEVGGKKLTAKDKIEDAIKTAFGTYDFEAEADGVPYTSATALARVIAQKAEASSASTLTIDGIKIDGIRVEADIAPPAYARDDNEKVVTFAALNAHGRTMAEYTAWLKGEKISAGSLLKSVLAIHEKLDARAFRASADHIRQDAERARGEASGLREQVQKEWDRAPDLQAKRARLKAVVTELSSKQEAKPKLSAAQEAKIELMAENYLESFGRGVPPAVLTAAASLEIARGDFNKFDMALSDLREDETFTRDDMVALARLFRLNVKDNASRGAAFDLVASLQAHEATAKQGARSVMYAAFGGDGLEEILVAPVESQPMFAMIGVKGGNDAAAMIREGQRLERKGVIREEIWKITAKNSTNPELIGAFKGAMGHWMVELDDGRLVTPTKLSGGKGFNFADQAVDIEYPHIKERYPDAVSSAKGMVTVHHFGDAQGFFDSATKKIEMRSTPEVAREIAAHELQHSIENEEGFPSGGSWKSQKQWASLRKEHITDQESWNRYHRLPGEALARVVAKRANLSREERIARPPWLDYDIPESEQKNIEKPVWKDGWWIRKPGWIRRGEAVPGLGGKLVSIPGEWDKGVYAGGRWEFTPSQRLAQRTEEAGRLNGKSAEAFPYSPAADEPLRTDEPDLREDAPASQIDLVVEKLRSTGVYEIPEEDRQRTFARTGDTIAKIAPSGTKLYVVKRIELGADGKAIVVYETAAGERIAWPDSTASVLTSFGFFDPAVNGIFVSRAAALGDPLHLARSVAVHEAVHAARTHGNFLPGAALERSWFRILAHANQSFLLDMPVSAYGRLIQDPLPRPAGITFADVYGELYKDAPDRQERMDGESVALAVQLYVSMQAANDPHMILFDPVKRDIEAFLSGHYKSGAQPEIYVNDGSVQPSFAWFGGARQSPAQTSVSQGGRALTDIIASLKDAIGLPAQQGLLGLTIEGAGSGKRKRFGIKSKVAGQYNRTAGQARYRYANDIETIAHEGGHHLEQIFGIKLQALKVRYATELDPLAYPGAIDKLSEGFAGFFSLFVLDPLAAEQAAPKFFQEFRDFLDTERPQILDGIDALELARTQADYARYLSQTETQRAANDLSSHTDAVPRDIRKLLYDTAQSETISGLATKLYTAALDASHPVFMLVKELLKTADINGITDENGSPISLHAYENPGKLLRSVQDAYKGGLSWIVDGMPNYRHQITTWKVTSTRDGRELASFNSEAEAHDWLGRQILSEPAKIAKTVAQNDYRSASLWQALNTALAGKWSDDGVRRFGAYLESRRAVEEWKRYTGRLRKLADLRAAIDLSKDALTDAKTASRKDEDKLERRKGALRRAETLLRDARRREARAYRREDDEANFQQFAGAALPEERRTREAIARREEELIKVKALRGARQADYAAAAERLQKEEEYRAFAAGLTTAQLSNASQRIRLRRSELHEAARRVDDLDVRWEDIEKELDELARNGMGHLSEKERVQTGTRMSMLRQEIAKIRAEVESHENSRREMLTDIGHFETVVDAHHEKIARFEDHIGVLRRDVAETEKHGVISEPHAASQATHEVRVAQFEQESPAFAKAAPMVYDFLRQTIIHDWQAGKLTLEEMKYRLGRSHFYVPYERDLTDVAWDREMLGSGGKGFKTGKAFKGSKRAVYNPIEVIIDQAFHRSAETAFNDFLQAIATLARRAGSGSASIVTIETQRELVDLDIGGAKKLEDSLIASGLDPADARDFAQRVASDWGDVAAFLSWSPGQAQKKALRIPFFENGTRNYLVFDNPEWAQALFSAVAALSRNMRGVWADAIAYPNMLLAGSIWMDVGFQAIHAFRMPWVAWMQSGQVFNWRNLPYINTLHGLGHMARGSGSYKLYLEAGGQVGGMHRDILSKKSDKLNALELKDRGIAFNPKLLWPSVAAGAVSGAAIGAAVGMPWAGGTVGAYGGAVAHRGLEKLKTPWKALAQTARTATEIMDVFETATKLGVVVEAAKAAKRNNPALTDYQAMEEGIFTGRSIFDGSRNGSRLGEVSRLAFAMNAHIQHGLTALEAFWAKHDRGLGVSPVKLIAAQAATAGMTELATGSVAAGVTAALALPVALLPAMQQSELMRRAMKPFFSYSSGEAISPNQKKALGDSAKLWAAFLAVSLMDASLHYLQKDDPEYQMVAGQVGNKWRPVKTLTGWTQLPKAFLFGSGGAILNAALDADTHQNPRFEQRVFGALKETMVPPITPTALRLYSGLHDNWDSFRDKPIVGPKLEGLPPAQQFDAYTSSIAKFLGQELNVSPVMVDWAIRSSVGFWGKDIQDASNIFAGQKPASLENFPVLGTAVQRFKLDPYKMSEGKQLYWDTLGGEGKLYPRAWAGYNRLLVKNPDPTQGSGHEQANAYLSTLPEDQRLYALFREQSGPSLQKRHPLIRLQEVMKIVSGMLYEINAGDLRNTTSKTITSQIPLSPSKGLEVAELLQHIGAEECHNAFVFIGNPAMTGKTEMDTGRLLETLMASSEDAYWEYLRRTRGGGILDWDAIKDAFPDLAGALIEEWQASIENDTWMAGQRTPHAKRIEDFEK